MKAPSQYIFLSEALGDRGAALALFDQLPSGDPRRGAIGGWVYLMLAEKRRYKEALEAKPFSRMLHNLELAERNANEGHRIVQVLLNATVRDVEVLVGAGRIDQARILANRLLKLDSSAKMKATLKARLKRAGNPTALD